MSKIKLTYNKVYKYVKGKSIFELALDAFAFGFLMPLALTGITFMWYMILTGQV